MLTTLFAGIAGLVLVSVGWISIQYRSMPPPAFGELTIPIGLLMVLLSVVRAWKSMADPPPAPVPAALPAVPPADLHPALNEDRGVANEPAGKASDYFYTSSDFYKILPETLIDLPAYKFAQVARFQGQESLRTAVAKILWLSNNRPLSNEEWRQVVLYLSVLEGFIVRNRAESGDASSAERYRLLFKQSGFSGTLALHHGAAMR